MTIELPRFIEGSALTYLVNQIGSGSPVPTKNALQELSKLYRRGYRIYPDELYRVQAIIMGLSQSQDDPKVQRWVLNSLAQIGDFRCRRTVISALDAYANDPEIVTAGVAALYKLSANPEDDLRRLNFPGQIVTLAALQHVRPEQLNLSALPIDVQRAGPDIIKPALVLVGLGRAPSNLFDPRHSNAEIVRVLGQHNDPVVSQYSVWAITENPALCVRDLGIDLRTIDNQPENVRGWVYRLLAMNEAAAQKHMELIEHGPRDRSVEARAGLALGLKDTYFDRLVAIVLNWFTTERDQRVRQNLLDHITSHAGRSPAYEDIAVGAYRRAGTSERERMRGAAARTPLYAAFRKVDYHSEGDLFMTTNTYNFNNSQIGAIAATGNAENSGQFIYQPHVIDLLKGELAQAKATIQGLTISDAEKQEISSAISDAEASPDSGKLRRAVSAISKATTLVTTVTEAENTLNQIIQGISKLAGFI